MNSDTLSPESFNWLVQDPVISWLQDPQEPSMRYLSARDLLDPRPSRTELEKLRPAASSRGWVSRIMAGQRNRTWWVTKKTCYVPKFRSTIWRLQVLADLGLTRKDDRIANAVELFFDLHSAKDGGYHPYSMTEPRHYGPRGHLCTTGNMVRSLVKLGYLRDERVQWAIDWLVDRQLTDGGWDCFWRRQGTLDAWEAMSAFAQIPPTSRSPEIRQAIEEGANFFLKRRLLHEGKPFKRWYWLRYPWHYFYDVLVGLDFMTSLGYGKDPRMKEALAHLISKRRSDGRWNLDHTNGDLRLETAGKASKMTTFLSLRVIKNVIAS